MVQSDSILTRLRRDLTADSVPAALDALYRPSVQEYLIAMYKYSGASEVKHLPVR